jgi:DNA-binding NarL/FixJ family response regulator
MAGDRVRVVVIDDHDLFRGGLVQLLEQRDIEVLGQAGLAADGIRQVCDLNPEVALMDLTMPGMSGIEATQRLAATAPLVRVLVLTVAADEQSVTDALLAGACGYLIKDAPIDHIVEGIRAARPGDAETSSDLGGPLQQVTLRVGVSAERGEHGAHRNRLLGELCP